MVIKRNWSHYVDALRDDLEANHPEIGLVDFSFYNLEVFNRCEHENALLLAVPQWEGVHPLLKILPVDWEHTIPFGFLHSPRPAPAVRSLIRTVTGDEKQALTSGFMPVNQTILPFSAPAGYS
ncbi:hypothetical protein [uncultured Oscillibacter sp.]|uniref:hypothetical protein n=1 Tax=uncultured Oscillibacter sp. TaxID=876091 RepID=UPI00262FFD07|nr:hypothetical protein [uncultured Oscillibacter sp.]